MSKLPPALTAIQRKKITELSTKVGIKGKDQYLLDLLKANNWNVATAATCMKAKS